MSDRRGSVANYDVGAQYAIVCASIVILELGL